MCDCNDTEIKLADTRATLDKMRRANSVLREDRDNTKAELADVWSHLADTAAALGTCRKMRVKMDNAICTLTEERDLARELFQGMVSEYANLLDRYTVKCDEYEGLASCYEAEHGEF